MKTYLDCIPCFVKQALRVGKITTNNEIEIKEILDITGRLIPDIPREASPPEIAKIIYDKIKAITGNSDAYSDTKRANIETAQEILPDIKKVIENHENPLFEAARLAIAGNVIDFGIYDSVDVEKDMLDSLKEDLTINDFSAFKQHLSSANNIFYIGDNSAEAVFDKLFIEAINKPVKYVVRGEAVLNDVTTKEAKMIGIDKVADIIPSGTSAPGNVISDCSEEFLAQLAEADLVISKGQGNYEALSGTKYPIFFFLKAKCEVIARDIGVPVNALLLMKSTAF